MQSLSAHEQLQPAHSDEFVTCSCRYSSRNRGTVRHRECALGVQTLQARLGEAGARFGHLSDHARGINIET